MGKWVEKEMSEVSLGDKRLNKRLKMVMEAVAKCPDQPFTKQFNTAAELKACYRLLDSDLISCDEVLKPHFKQTLKRASEQDVVVVASDSSSANYTTRKSNPDTGYISSNNAQGFLLHTSLATTLDRLPLGVIASKYWSREKEKPRKKVHRDYLPIEEKESFKWIESYRQAQQLADNLPDTQVINVADKEADILELWKEAIKNSSKSNPAHLVVRSNHNRAVAPTETNPSNRLQSFLLAIPSIGSTQFELIDRKTHKVKRVVTQEIRATSLTIRPVKRPGVEATEIELNAVLLSEIDTPDGEKPVEWCLLTTLPVETRADVDKVIQTYLARWDIEILFRTFKSGCKIEDRSLRTANRIYAMFSIFLIVAWRINMLVCLARSAPDLPCSIFFSELEWKSAIAATTKSLTIPDKVPSIQEMVIMVATLGGYLNRKSDPDPGATVIWRGFSYLQGFTDALALFSNTTHANSGISVKNTCG